MKDENPAMSTVILASVDKTCNPIPKTRKEVAPGWRGLLLSRTSERGIVGLYKVGWYSAVLL